LTLLTPNNLVLLIVAMLFLLGMATFITGVLTLALRASSSDVKTLAAQTARLAQKGMAEEVVGLVGNASELMDAMNQLVRTTRGVGMFLTILGLAIMGFAGWLAVQIYRMQP